MSLTQNGTLGGSGSGTPVVLTDNTNGTLTVDNGSTPQNTIRPIPELSILTRQNIDPAADYEVIYDASTGNHVRSLATRASQTAYLGDGLNDTRTGNLGNINTSIYAAWDHQHPLVALAIPALPKCAVSGSGGTFVSQTIARVRATEETVTYTIQVTTTNTAATTWLTITPPAITGFYLTKVVNSTYDAASVSTVPYLGTHPSFVWAGTTIYLRPRAINLNLVHNIILEYTLN